MNKQLVIFACVIFNFKKYTFKAELQNTGIIITLNMHQFGVFSFMPTQHTDIWEPRLICEATCTLLPTPVTNAT